ncbi:MAG: protease modulator HflC [SAR202 cluster bacterium]|nr:protease modulator HflC [SAR202 cluster bacterium]
MKYIAIILILGSVAAGIIGPQAFFVVDEKQLAIVTRFGEVIRSIKNPGLGLKTPFVDNVTYFDKRLLIFDAPPDSLLTLDKKRLIIDVYGRGRINDPKLFRETVRTETQAAARAVDIISSELRREISLDNQAEIITTSREQIMLNVLEGVRPELTQFGIELVDIRIKRADFPNEIAESVYARMQAERQRKADKERAEGAEIDATVRAEVDKEATIIKAEAEKLASITRGEGEAQAVKIFADAIGTNQEFYTFQRSLEAYQKIFKDKTTVVLPADSDLFQFLQSPIGMGTTE